MTDVHNHALDVDAPTGNVSKRRIYYLHADLHEPTESGTWEGFEPANG
ncbi:MAG: hypothetical protein ACREPU_06180 [Rhodanobacteraceae bacterium]